LEDELEAIKKEEAQIHETFRRKLLQNQQRLKEYQNSEFSKRKTFDQEYQKNIEELHKKYKNQLEDRTVCKKCYNRVVPSSQICIGCQMPVCKNCQEDPISWGCHHFNVEVASSHMDIDNENNKKLTLNMNNVHDTQVNRLPKEICCKDCIISLLPKRCEKCFKRLCQNKTHSICTICSSNNSSNNKTTINKIGNTSRMILLCDICQEAVHQYQNSLHNKDNDNISLKYTYINDAYLFNECANPSCHARLCKSCTEKEGASCLKCQRVYCSHCQKNNNFIKIMLDSSENDQHSHWECISCIKAKNENLKQKMSNSSSSNNEIEKDEKDMMITDEHHLSPQEKQTSHQEDILDSVNDSNMTITETETTTVMASAKTNINISENPSQNVDTANTSNTTIVITTSTTTTTTTTNYNVSNINNNKSHNNNQKEDNDNTNSINNSTERNDESSEELIFLNDKENIPLHKNNTKKKIKEIEEKLSSQSRSKYFNKVMKIRPELKSYQKEFNSPQNNNSNESLSNEQMNLDKSNKTENVTVKPLEKALSHVSLE